MMILASRLAEETILVDIYSSEDSVASKEAEFLIASQVATLTRELLEAQGAS